MGLNDSYAQTQSQILMMKPFPSLTKVFALVIQEEWHRNINYGSSSFGDLLVLGDYNSAWVNAHISNVPSKGKLEHPQCVYYGLQGNTMDKCYKLHGYPPWYKPWSKNSMGQAQAHQTTFVVSGDTGSLHHMQHWVLFSSTNVNNLLLCWVHSCIEPRLPL